MTAELQIKNERTEFDSIFGGDTDTSYTVTLTIKNNPVAKISNVNIEALYEILNINKGDSEFEVDGNRINYISHKYKSNNNFEEFKKLLRPLIKYDVKTVEVCYE